MRTPGPILEAVDGQDAAAPAPSLYLPSRLLRWLPEMEAAGRAHGVEVVLLAAVMDRESEGSFTLRPHGDASGTGDWTARVGHWLHSPHVRVVATLPVGWRIPDDTDGKPHGGPYAVPEDGLGWGRGLMQHDFHRALAFDWRDPAVNIVKGAELLADLLAEFPKALSSAVAAYNCGPANVRRAILLGHDCDHLTTGHDYSADVLRRRASFLSPPDGHPYP